MGTPFNYIKDQEILNKLRDSDLVRKCIDFAKEYGKVTKEVFSFNTQISASHQIGDLEINSEEGVNSQGNAYMSVKSKGETVLSASIDYGVEKENRVKRYGIGTYVPGKWEDYIFRVMDK